MKNLTSFMYLNVNGIDRVTYTFDEIDDNTGELKTQNNKNSFFAVDEELKKHLTAIKEYITKTKLSEE